MILVPFLATLQDKLLQKVVVTGFADRTVLTIAVSYSDITQRNLQNGANRKECISSKRDILLAMLIEVCD